MAETTFTVRIDEELKAAFAEAAKSRGYTEEELLEVLIQEEVHRQAATPEYDAWFRAEVGAGHPRSRRFEHQAHPA